MGSIKDILKANVRQYAMIIALIIIMVLFQVLTKGILLTPQNVTNLVLQNSYVIILAVGMVLCIIGGGNIDLSVGSVVAVIGAIVGTLMATYKIDISIAILIAIFAGLAIGAWQGYWIAYLRIPAFIVTLAGMLLFRGLTNTILQGQTISPLPEGFLKISSGYVPDFFKIPGVKLNITTIIFAIIISIIYILLEIKGRRAKKKYNFEVMSLSFFILKIIIVLAAINAFAYSLVLYRGIPILLVIISVLVIIYSFFTLKTVPGRYIYAMGGNEKAAKLSGINTNKVLFFSYVNMGVLAAVTGVIFTARLGAASPLAGQGFELDAIAACFIGGASALGGSGTVMGAVIGALVMGVLNNGMSIIGLGSDIQMSIKGLVLLAAVAFDVISKARSKA